MSRCFAIGDIHGCSSALDALLSKIQPRSADTIVTLGDYVDRGPDSKGVLDRLIALSKQCHLIPLLGNHDEMMLNARFSRSAYEGWMSMKGLAALESYGAEAQMDLIPKAHFQFLESCKPYFETDTHIFLHANYKPDMPLSLPDEHTHRWLSLRDYVPPKPHVSGKTVIVGHTPQAEVLDLGYLICIDTGCATGGKLTAIHVQTGKIFQATQC